MWNRDVQNNGEGISLIFLETYLSRETGFRWVWDKNPPTKGRGILLCTFYLSSGCKPDSVPSVDGRRNLSNALTVTLTGSWSTGDYLSCSEEGYLVSYRTKPARLCGPVCVA